MNVKFVEKFLTQNGFEKYRAAQIREMVYKNFAGSFEEMTVLPLELRNLLKTNFALLSFRPERIIASKDSNALKAAFCLKDGAIIESVLMSSPGNKWNACLSTQVGCPLNCSFCATGRMGFKRNLSAEEITDQVLFWNQYLRPSRISNLVFMGMGEPFLNYDAVKEALDIIISPDFFGMGQRHVSVSTAGHIPGILRFAKDFPEANLAISLNACSDEIRDEIMPINRKYPMKYLSQAVSEYLDLTGRKIFIEYVLLKGVNDGGRDANLLSEWIKKTGAVKLFNVNLIAYNRTSENFTAPSPGKIMRFKFALEKSGIPVTLRKSFGPDINAACGQLGVSLGLPR
ncbi:MAG: 23S rRNA (adenine(2503)-C(2))-methyltransferase RlmN [Elusimicrobia bacterium]|nr:23S rRNA (adenine(2503)-C(2))-methyltransferase RlmN [Elusimicrobiota bacterium]